jgi:lysozyme
LTRTCGERLTRHTACFFANGIVARPPRNILGVAGRRLRSAHENWRKLHKRRHRKAPANQNKNNMLVPTILDASHHQDALDLNVAKQAGILGVFHKCTQGSKSVEPMFDSMFDARRKECADLGLKWGAYHFGVGSSSGKDQAGWFLENAKYGKDTLCILDWEANHGADKSDNSMTLDQAAEFIDAIAAATKAPPLLYGQKWFLDAHTIARGKFLPLNDRRIASLVECKLWIADVNTVNPKLPHFWTAWTFHQYTNGKDGPMPRRIAGLPDNLDLNVFAGESTELAALWAS